MTKDQVAALIEQIPKGLTPDDFLVALANAVEAAEREACAEVTEKHRDGWALAYTRQEWIEVWNHCAADIRARGEK